MLTAYRNIRRFILTYLEKTMQEQFTSTEPVEPIGAATTPATVAQLPAGPTKPNPKPPVARPPVPTSVDPLLATILSYKRPHESAMETEFVRTWLTSQVAGFGFAPMWKSGNMVVVVPVPDKEGLPSVLFSCHVDTMHRTSGVQQVMYDAVRGEIFLDAKAKDNECLGADDGTGVWLMLRMIEAKVPGAYVFHRGEERGCIGSRKMADEQKEWLGKFSVAVAFDRPRNNEVITHQQGGTRLASDECGTAMATALNNLSGGLFAYEISNRGVVTDTAFYGEFIAECFNLGVGYQNQHGPTEVQDYAHAAKLLEVCKAVNWHGLPIHRKPEPRRAFSAYRGNTYQGAGRSSAEFDGYGEWWEGVAGRRQGSMFPAAGAREFGAPRPVDRSGNPKGKGKGKLKSVPGVQNWARNTAPELTLADELEELTTRELTDLIGNDPRKAALWMSELIADLRGAEARFKTLRAAWLTDTDAPFAGY